MSKPPWIWHLARPEVECAWEEGHQRAALERHGLMDLYMGCDSIDVVCERLTALRSEVASLRALLGKSRREHARDCWHSPGPGIRMDFECNCGADEWNAKLDAMGVP